MKLKFHGGRGSYPVSPGPERIQQIARSVWEFATKNKYKTWAQVEKGLKGKDRSLYQIYGGNTTCAEIKSDKSLMPLLIDAGTGITAAAFDPKSALNNADFKKGKGKMAIFLSHTHWDHIIGLPTIEQIYKKGNEFHFYGVHKNLEQRIKTLFQDEHFPVPFSVVRENFHFHQIPLNTILEFGDLTIQHFPQTHPGGSFAYRINDGKSILVFATDTELKNINPPNMIPGESVYSNADVLVLDAQFSPEDFPTRQGYGHADIYAAVDFAVRERVKRLYLFHQAPEYDDRAIDKQLSRARQYYAKEHAKKSKLEIEMTIEGEEITV